MFNFDWFHHGGLQRLTDDARRRCADRKFPDHGKDGNGTAEYEKYLSELESRLIIYMKDGLTYEVRELADIEMRSALVFECVPVDENYKVGAIVIVAPFDDIARVEVFAVHPDEKPQESFRIPGFRAGAEAGRDPNP